MHQLSAYQVVKMLEYAPVLICVGMVFEYI